MGFNLSGIALIHCYANNDFANVSFAKLYASNLGNVEDDFDRLRSEASREIMGLLPVE
jgi:hypothetical protein